MERTTQSAPSPRIAVFDHLFQSGFYDGTLTIDGETQQIDGWYGQRDTIVDVGHDLNFDENLDLVSGRVEVAAESGARYVIDADADADGGYVAGGA